METQRTHPAVCQVEHSLLTVCDLRHPVVSTPKSLIIILLVSRLSLSESGLGIQSDWCSKRTSLGDFPVPLDHMTRSEPTHVPFRA